MSNKIAKIVVGLPVDGPFDYAVSKDFRDCISIGQRVRISFNRRNRVGFVVGSANRSAFKKLNPILSLLDDGPALDGHAVELAKTFSAYYGCSLGEAIETFLPSPLRRDRFSLSSATPPAVIIRDAPADNRTILIHDQTRHKRWPYIIKHIDEVIDAGKRVIVLVPEKSFIGETVAALEKKLTCSIAVFDKKLTPKKELERWEQIRNGDFSVVIGTRSAIFAPVANLGLIVIDDEENGAYKQEQAPHYRAHEVARMRSAIDQCRIIFASSLPSAETWEEAKKNKWEKVNFKDDNGGKVQIIDMNNYNPRKTSILSFPLQNAIQKTLENNGKIILFMNRIGFTTQTHCQQCGFILKCERCDVNLTYLHSKKIMACRHCNYKRELPKVCPECRGSYLKSMGRGVEKLESETARLYPGARIYHYDRQSKVFPKHADIIITTQAIFRRHDQWTVALVAILNFDAQMYHVDFRCGHKAFSLLVHLKQFAKENFLIQTRMRDSYCVQSIKDMSFDKFYRQELELRKELQLPPYKHLVALGLRGVNEESVLKQSMDLFDKLDKLKPKGVMVSDPHPDVNPKLRDKYRFTILLKGKSVKKMLAHIKLTLKGFRKKGVMIAINVDP